MGELLVLICEDDEIVIHKIGRRASFKEGSDFFNMVVGGLGVIFGPSGGSRSSVRHRHGSAVDGDPPGPGVAVVVGGVLLRDLYFRVQPRILHTVGTVIIFFPGEGKQIQKALESLAHVAQVLVPAEDVLNKQVRYLTEAGDVFPGGVDFPKQAYSVVEGVVVVADIQGRVVLYGRTATTPAAGHSWNHC